MSYIIQKSLLKMSILKNSSFRRSFIGFFEAENKYENKTL
jgi:hypothetical protein